VVSVIRIRIRPAVRFPAQFNAIPGIDEAYVSFITLKAGPPEGVTFVIWSDLSKVAGGRGGGGGWKGAYKEGHLLGPDEEEKKRRKGVRSLFRIFFLMSPVGSRHS